MPKFLFAAADPIGSGLDFRVELHRIDDTWSSLAGQDTLRARWAVSIEQIEIDLGSYKPDIFHLVNPGRSKKTDYIIMCDKYGGPDYVRNEDIYQIFARQKDRNQNPRLVFYNFCNTDELATLTAPFVGCSIGVEGVVSDSCAIKFADLFYDSLAKGRNIGDSFSKAQSDSNDEAKYVLQLGNIDIDRPIHMPVNSVRKVPDKPKSDAILAFCSYAHEDARYRNDLETALAVLRRSGELEIWHDRKIAGGEKWASEINGAIEKAKLILILASPDFLDSEYCMGMEYEKAYTMHQSGSAKIIPIYIRECLYEESPLGRLQRYPEDKPVKKYRDKDEAWAYIARKIKVMLEEMGRSRAFSR